MGKRTTVMSVEMYFLLENLFKAPPKTTYLLLPKMMRVLYFLRVSYWFIFHPAGGVKPFNQEKLLWVRVLFECADMPFHYLFNSLWIPLGSRGGEETLSGWISQGATCAEKRGQQGQLPLQTVAFSKTIHNLIKMQEHGENESGKKRKRKEKSTTILNIL